MFELVLQRAQRSLDVEGCFDITQLDTSPDSVSRETPVSSKSKTAWPFSPAFMSCKYIVYWLLLLSILITQRWKWVIVHVHTRFIHRIQMKSRFTSHNKNTKRDRWDHKQFLKIIDWQHKNVTSWVTNFKLDFSPSPWHNVRAGFPH